MIWAVRLSRLEMPSSSRGTGLEGSGWLQPADEQAAASLVLRRQLRTVQVNELAGDPWGALNASGTLDRNARKHACPPKSMSNVAHLIRLEPTASLKTKCRYKLYQCAGLLLLKAAQFAALADAGPKVSYFSTS